jgi:hypothetical protein
LDSLETDAERRALDAERRALHAEQALEKMRVENQKTRQQLVDLLQPQVK